jgi:hypothetical protein
MVYRRRERVAKDVHDETALAIEALAELLELELMQQPSPPANFDPGDFSRHAARSSIQQSISAIVSAMVLPSTLWPLSQ